jgi:hypothetical protein
MEERAAFLDDIRYRLEQAQAVQKRVYDQHHRPVFFQVGDWALLRLRQRAAASLPRSATGKLKPWYVGPYQVTELINEVVVRLQLPPGACLHDVFHVGVLKKFVGNPPTVPPLLPPLLHGAVVPTPARVTRARLARGVRQVLVEWQGEPPASATWEDLDDLLPFSSRTSWTSRRGEMSCADAHMPGAGPISNIFSISNSYPIGNIYPIGNVFSISNI